jgi:hypothetical protein
MTRKANITIYGKTEDESVTLPFLYEYYEVTKWMSEDRSTTFVNYVKILEPIPFTPSGLTEDLTVAVAEDLGENPFDIRIDADPIFRIKKTQTEIQTLAA